MTTEEKTTHHGGSGGTSFSCCGEMMKMMSRCREGKEDKKNFEQFCGKMSMMCRDLMKDMDAQSKEKGE